MTALRIVGPGGISTIQDLGRPGYQRFGVPDHPLDTRRRPVTVADRSKKKS